MCVLLINFPLKHFHGNEWESKIPVKGGSFVIIMFLILENILDIPDIFITFFLLALFHSFMVFIMADTLDSGGQEYNKMEISLTEFVKLSY